MTLAQTARAEDVFATQKAPTPAGMRNFEESESLSEAQASWKFASRTAGRTTIPELSLLQQSSPGMLEPCEITPSDENAGAPRVLL